MSVNQVKVVSKRLLDFVIVLLLRNFPDFRDCRAKRLRLLLAQSLCELPRREQLRHQWRGLQPVHRIFS